MLRTKQQVLSDIQSNNDILSIFNSWQDYQQKEFIDICTGARGVKMLYDSYFKEVFNTEYDSERLSLLLSTLIGKKVTVRNILPNDTTRLGDEQSLIITDIVVELEDSTIANVEMQKLGYAFTGERASCYSADLLLRQYKRVRASKENNFSYKDIAPVYTIVFMEKSPALFHKYKNTYIHKMNITSDTGISMNMLQNFIFIPIDIFLEKLHNEGIQSYSDAWMTFLGCDEPEYIIDLIQQYPYFKALYNDIYNLCLNTERMINMFSKELQILDRNTVKYMIDELQDELNETQNKLSEAKDQLNETKNQLNETKDQLNETKNQLNEANTTIASLQSEISMLKNN
jgi:hypothetical protein